MPYFEVHLDDRDLQGAGYHREDDCEPKLTPSDGIRLMDAIVELHQLGHEDQPLHPERCMREPCRTLFARDLEAVSFRYILPSRGLRWD